MICTGILPNIGMGELVVILVIVLLIFGPGKLPEVAKAIGKSLKSFKNAQKSVETDITNAIKDADEDSPTEKSAPENNGKSE